MSIPGCSDWFAFAIIETGCRGGAEVPQRGKDFGRGLLCRRLSKQLRYLVELRGAVGKHVLEVGEFARVDGW